MNNKKKEEINKCPDDQFMTRTLEQLTDGKDDLDPMDHQNEADAAQKDPEENLSAGKELFFFLRSFAIFVLAWLIVSNYIVLPIQVQGSSMYPTLEDKASGLSNLLGKETSNIERFDIVIINIKGENKRIVKRVIGLPGETVSYQNGKLSINGEPRQETFLNQAYVESYKGTFMTDVAPITLGADEYYCLGDNRPHSSDSRYYGAFKAEDITAKGIFILFPFHQFGVKTW